MVLDASECWGPGGMALLANEEPVGKRVLFARPAKVVSDVCGIPAMPPMVLLPVPNLPDSAWLGLS